MSALGRRVPTDWKHVEKFPLTALATTDRPKGVPVVIGINWYSDFDDPVLDSSGRWWVAKEGIKGSIRGGHCVCLKPGNLTDPTSWWVFYNQLREGKCVGEGNSRMMSILNRVRYDATWLWHRARLTDEWTDNDDLSDNDQGTSVRAALEILRTEGLKRDRMHAESNGAQLKDGISAYRWATDVQDVLTTLNMPLATKLGAVPFLNSWGKDYPHIVWMPGEVLSRLQTEDGEIGIITDR
jgi:hypothetical protein